MNSPLYDVLTKRDGITKTIQNVQDFLGTFTCARWALAVYRIVLGNMHISMTIDNGEPENLRGKLPVTLDMPSGYRLGTIRGIYQNTKPVRVKNDTWPYLPNVSILYSTPSTVKLTYGNKTVTAKCVVKDKVLDISWPEDTGIVGALICDRIPYRGMTVTIPALLQYPSSAVVEAAKKTQDVLELLERTNLVDEFYFGDSPDEQIAVIVLAMYKEVYNGRQK